MDDHDHLASRLSRAAMSLWRIPAKLAVSTLLPLAFVTACTKPMVPPADPKIDVFFDRVQAKNGQVWLEEDADQLVQSLPPEATADLAERAIAHPDSNVRVYGLGLLYRIGRSSEGDEAAAELLVKGDDLRGLAWSWMHSEDRSLLDTRLNGIRAALSKRLPSMQPAQRKAAEKFLCEGREACAGETGD